MNRVGSAAATAAQSGSSAHAAADLQFVAIAESGKLETQALMLCRSIRAFAGAYRSAPILIVSPRKSRRPSRRFRRELDALDVEFLAADLDSPCPEYGPSFRLAAMAHVARRPGPALLVQMDSDTLWLEQPEFPLHDADVLARPVDVKGVCTAGEGDARDAYWRALCALCEIDYDAMPWLSSTVDGVRVKANYNAGLIVARRADGLFERTEQIFRRIVAGGFRTHALEPSAHRIGSGEISAQGFTYFGTVQVAQALACTALALRVRLLPPTYNVPLHFFAQLARAAIEAPVHVHYHWLFEPEFLDTNPLLDGRLRLAREPAAWLQGLHAPRADAAGDSLWTRSASRMRQLFAAWGRAV